MNEVVVKLYKIGIVSTKAINEYISGLVDTDNSIKELLQKLGVLRRVNSMDRDFYKTWTENWNFNQDIINLVAEKSKTAAQPIRYMNKILLELNNKNIRTIEKVEEELAKTTFFTPQHSTKNDFSEREYTKEELDALFDSLDDIEV